MSIRTFVLFAAFLAVFSFGFMVGEVRQSYSYIPNTQEIGRPVPMPSIDVNQLKELQSI